MSEHRIEYQAIQVNQWLPEWEKVQIDSPLRREPPRAFFLFSVPAIQLLSLSGVNRRSTRNRTLGNIDLGIQRTHDRERSDEISRYVQFGFPASSPKVRPERLRTEHHLRMPGWLANSIVANIVLPGEERDGRQLLENDAITVRTNDLSGSPRIILPESYDLTSNWQPTGCPPIDIIDGQHRLLAFQDNAIRQSLNIDKFELPVVAFVGLDLAWQAYLFWIINIRPKKINASLAFDLYPLLRTQEWLEETEGPSIYRETRSQELVETLWAHPKSPWHNRINMLGETGLRGVTQASWIRSLMNSFIKSGRTRAGSTGGLFGSEITHPGSVLMWSRSQQASFLVMLWTELWNSVKTSQAPWAQSLRRGKTTTSVMSVRDPAFSGAHTLLNTDQGVRAFLQVSNDLCYRNAGRLRLSSWRGAEVEDDSQALALDEDVVTAHLKSLDTEPVRFFVIEFCKDLSEYDWRSASAPELSEDERMLKSRFRGSGGYKQLRVDLLKHLANYSSDAALTANDLLVGMGYLDDDE